MDTTQRCEDTDNDMAHAVTHSRTKHTYTHTKIVREIDDTRVQTVRENSTQTARGHECKTQISKLTAHARKMAAALSRVKSYGAGAHFALDSGALCPRAYLCSAPMVLQNVHL